jgi:hypothetical protein
MLVGYMRIPSESDRQITDLQRDALLAAASTAAPCLKITPLAPRMIGWDLNEALTFVRQGDVLGVWKLDRLGRSLSHCHAS